jgi:hypothetical protein
MSQRTRTRKGCISNLKATTCWKIWIEAVLSKRRGRTRRSRWAMILRSMMCLILRSNRKSRKE